MQGFPAIRLPFISQALDILRYSAASAVETNALLSVYNALFNLSLNSLAKALS